MAWAEGVEQTLALLERRGRVMAKDRKMVIKEVFEQFLSEQQLKLAPKTYRDYASVIELFEHQLDGSILRTFFERKGLTNEATNWLNVVIESHAPFNR